MSEESHERRLSDKLKTALDEMEKRGNREHFAEVLRQIYEELLADEKRYRPNRRIARHTHER